VQVAFVSAQVAQWPWKHVPLQQSVSVWQVSRSPPHCWQTVPLRHSPLQQLA
jgi:hypothetical protein